MKFQSYNGFTLLICQETDPSTELKYSLSASQLIFSADLKEFNDLLLGVESSLLTTMISIYVRLNRQ